MKYLCLVLIFLWKSEFTVADDNELFSLNFGPVKIGESKIPNYSFVYGMFISTNDSSYKNIWIRMGKKIFWELNYINWQAEEQRAQLLGLSVGIPLNSFF